MPVSKCHNFVLVVLAVSVASLLHSRKMAAGQESVQDPPTPSRISDSAEESDQAELTSAEANWLHGWWTIDHLATLEMMKGSVELARNPSLLNNLSIYAFRFGPENAQAFMMQSGEGPWHLLERADGKWDAVIEIANAGDGVRLVLEKKNDEKILLGPARPPLKIALRRLSEPVTDPEALADACKPLQGSWSVDVEKTREICELRGISLSQENAERFAGLKIRHQGESIVVVSDTGDDKILNWKPFVCETSADKTFVIGLRNDGSRVLPMAWTVTGDRAIVTASGLPLIFQRQRE